MIGLWAPDREQGGCPDRGGMCGGSDGAICLAISAAIAILG